MGSDRSAQGGADIGRQQLGSVYAKAFLGAMENSGVTDECMAEFDSLIHDVLDRFPALDATLSSPRLSGKEKNSLLDRVFGAKMSDSLLTFLKVVAGRGRLDCLREIHDQARRQLNEQRGLVEVHLTTAEPVSSALGVQIADALQSSLGRQVQLRQSTDPDLIGGMVVRVGDKVFDGSVVNQLARLRAETLEKTVQEMRNAADRFAAAD